MFSLKHEFPSEWHSFLHPDSTIITPESETITQSMMLGCLRDRLPFFATNQMVKSLKLQSVMLVVSLEGLAAEELTISLLQANQPEQLNTDIDKITTTPSTSINQLQQYAATDQAADLNGFWALRVDKPLPFMTTDMLKDAWLVIKYQLVL
ncbi:MAG: hypothetical protein F6K10_18085 [Moorea sp. SIO2B7]|nr:hypothetical protein [Moorena sp. SIO2B7]